MILHIALAAPYVIELLAPIEFKSRAFLGQDHPSYSNTDACQGLRIGRGAFGVPSMSEIDELCKLQSDFTGCKAQQWKSRFK